MIKSKGGYLALRSVDVLRLSRASITGHRKRNRLVVLLLVSLFCLIFIFSMVYQGLENSVLRTSAMNTKGAVYIKTGLVNDYYYHKDYGKLISRQHRPDNAEEIVKERVKAHHGEIIGVVSDASSQQEWKYNIISQSAVKEFITQADVEIGKITVVKAQADTSEIGDKFQVAGTYPSTASGGLRVQNVIFEPIFEQIRPSPKEMFIVDDGSKEFQEYLTQENKTWRKTHGYDYDPEPTILMVAKFNSAKDAANYYFDTVTDGVKYGYNLSSGYQYVVKDLFNNTISVTMSFMFYQMILLGLGLLFAIFAIWITVLTFTHIADEDVATIALYRSMGAKSIDIYLIYGVYLLILCLLALAICLVLALLVAGGFAIFTSEELATTLKDFYQLPVLPQVGFLGGNIVVIAITFAMILTAPITLLFTGRKFSAKHIARKLKE